MTNKNPFANKSVEEMAEIAAKKSATWANKSVEEMAEIRAKMSAAKKGKNHPMYNKTQSDEWKAKRSAAMMGKKRTDEQKAKYSAAKKGIKWYYNPETNDNKRLRPEQIVEYEALGYIPGRVAWKV